MGHGTDIVCSSKDKAGAESADVVCFCLYSLLSLQTPVSFKLSMNVLLVLDIFPQSYFLGLEGVGSIVNFQTS